MPMPTDKYKEKVVFALEAAIASDPDFFAAGVTPLVERPRDTAHGDFSSPVALHLAAVLKRPPEKSSRSIAGIVGISRFCSQRSIAGRVLLTYG